MFENTTHLQIRRGALDDCLLALRAYIVPILRSQSGLLSLAVLPDSKTSSITILSIWDSPACAKAVEANPHYRREVRRLDPLIVNITSYTRHDHARKDSVIKSSFQRPPTAVGMN